ncbi:MAG: ammonium transporter [Actinomyces sp.]|nr:MAG: ammonium transporter [Actinomyces sp.]
MTRDGDHAKESTVTDRRITPDDLEASFRALKDEIDGTAGEVRERAIPVLVLAGVLALVVAYLLGKRVGRTRSTVVEIRRI